MARDPATHVGVVVLVDGAEVACDPESLAPGVLSGLSVTWGRDNRLSQPAASTCDLELVDPDGGTDYVALLRFGSVVEVLAVMPSGSRLRVFMGNVSDLTVTHEDGTDAIVKVTAIDPTASLSSVMIGERPWPAQTPAQRRSSIIAALPSGTLHWPALPAQVLTGAFPQARLDVDNQTAWDVISTFLLGIGLVPYPISYGKDNQPGLVHLGPSFRGLDPAYDTRPNRREPYAQFLSEPDPNGTQYPVPTVVLDACDVDLDGTEFTANPDDALQTIRVAWGGSQEESEGGTGTFVRTYTGTPGIDNTRAFDVTSCAPSGPMAGNVASQWSSHMNTWSFRFIAPWGVGALRLDPDTVTEMDDFNVLMGRVLEQTTRIAHGVMLQNLPDWAPWRAYKTNAREPHVLGYLEGGVYTYDEGRWVLDMNVSIELPLEGSLAPPLEMVVKPGDVVPFANETASVVFTADPSVAWAPGQYATFNDGRYGWDGSAWVYGGTSPIVVTPFDTVAVKSTDARVRPEPPGPWLRDDYATFSDGVFRFNGTRWVTYIAPILVAPGSTTPLAHTDPAVRANPETAWTAGQYATFSDGPYRWTGTAWQAVTIVVPLQVVPLAHDDITAMAKPLTPWAAGQAAGFTDGDYLWNGSAWVPGVRNRYVKPGDVVDVAHDTVGVVADPLTAWATLAYATFTDGTFRWTGTAWEASTVVEPYGTYTFTHDAANVTPNPSSAWFVPDSGSLYFAPAWFADGTWSWQRTYWQAVTVVEPGGSTDANPVDPRVTPWPYSAWEPGESATLNGDPYRWTGSAWEPYLATAWDNVAEGVAWEDVPAGTSWEEWTGSI